MFHSCGTCLGAIDPDEVTFVRCNGTCDKIFHPTCVNIPSELLRHLRSFPGLSWKCADCNRKCFCIDQVGLNTILNEKYTEMLQNLNTVFADLKTGFLKIAETKLSESKSPTTSSEPMPYSDILKNKTQPAILIKPKTTQTAVKTRVDLKENISTVDMQLSLSKVKSMKNGDMLVGFNSKEDNNRFKKAADEKLADKYDIVMLKGVQPRIKIVGLNQIYTEAEIVDYVEHAIRNNITDINLTAECSFIKLWPTKKNAKIYQAIVQLDRKSYETVMNMGALFIGYDYCNVYDAVEILRCFNCNGYHHSSKHCKNKKSCPRCAKVNDEGDELLHKVSECNVDHFQCINCITAIKNGEADISSNHAAWDTCCPIYIRAVERFKKDLLFKQ